MRWHVTTEVTAAESHWHQNSLEITEVFPGMAPMCNLQNITKKRFYQTTVLWKASG